MLEAALIRAGAAIAFYGRRVVDIDRFDCRLDAPLPPEPVIFVDWHEANLMAIAVHRLTRSRSGAALAPTGFAGHAMRGWLKAAGIEAITLKRASSRTAMRALCQAIAAGHDVLIAVDGPVGPARIVQDGAAWIAARTGAPVIPVGFAATPHLRLPRWDRLIVPLPGARTITVMGKPIAASGSGGDTRASLLVALDDVTARARMIAAEHATEAVAEHALWN